MRDYDLYFNAGETKTINAGGNCIHIVEASSPVVVLLDESASNSKFTRSSGSVLKITGFFGSFKITSQVAQSIKICAGKGESYNSGSIDLLGDINVPLSKANHITDFDDIEVSPLGTVRLIASDPNRETLKISLSSDANFAVRYGSQVSGTKGSVLYPAAVEFLNTTAELFVYNPDPDNSAFVSVQSQEVI